jgi:DNA (cytosine-5)-methyltransferase 1
MPKQLRFLSVCSGIEAASVAWEQLGWKAAGFAEIEPFPAAVLKHRYPTVPNFGDLNGHEQWPLAAGDVDIIVGGPPCQAFSVAGLREGMADPRGNLSLVYFQLVSRLRPKWIVYENVPGLLSARGGQDFSSLLSALAECGYGFAYRMLDAANFGLAQRRKRIFIVGCRTGDWRHPTAVLFDGPSSFGNPKAGKKAGEGSASPAGASVGSPSRIQLPFGTRGNPNVANCLETTSHDYSRADGFNMVVDHVPRNDERSEALPVIAGMIASSPIIERELIGTLCARDYKGVGSQYVQEGKCIPVQPPIAFKVRGGGEYTGTKGGEVRPNERGGTGMLHYEDKTFTVAATQDQFVATPSQPIPINTMAALRDQSAEQNRQTFGVGQPGDSMYTITKAHHHAVGVQQQLLYENHAQDSRVTGPHDLAPTVAAKFGTGGGNVPLGQAADPVTFQPGNLRRDAGADPSTETTTTLKASMGDQMPHIATPMAVRRLLPSECEALQGFPRDWTKIPWRNKPADLCPDGPRYKAIGNSMATNCMAWIGKRIQMVDEVIG